LVTAIAGLALASFAAALLRVRSFGLYALMNFVVIALVMIMGGAWIARATGQPRPALALDLGVALALALMMIGIRSLDRFYLEPKLRRRTDGLPRA
jgi:hypothetical protein